MTSMNVASQSCLVDPGPLTLRDCGASSYYKLGFPAKDRFEHVNGFLLRNSRPCDSSPAQAQDKLVIRHLGGSWRDLVAETVAGNSQGNRVPVDSSPAARWTG